MEMTSLASDNIESNNEVRNGTLSRSTRIWNVRGVGGNVKGP